MALQHQAAHAHLFCQPRQVIGVNGARCAVGVLVDMDVDRAVQRDLLGRRRRGHQQRGEGDSLHSLGYQSSSRTWMPVPSSAFLNSVMSWPL